LRGNFQTTTPPRLAWILSALKSGRIIRMFDAYHDGELQWLATILRRVLRVPADPLPLLLS
jgi:hypothetical protein